jgi:hypothetical protein
MEESEIQRQTRGGRNALEFGMKYGSGNHYYFCHFVNAASLPPEPLTSETSLSKKT